MGRDALSRTRGFTLLEIAVALAVLGAVLAAVLPQLSDALRAAVRAGNEREAVLLAQSKLAELEAAPVLGEASGALPRGYGWRSTVQRFGGPAAAYRATVAVSWNGGRRSVSLTTVLLAPAP